MSKEQEVPEVIRNLRDAMANVRAAQLTGHLSLHEVMYDVETDSTNRQFLQDFLDILPVDFAYPGNVTHHTDANKITVKEKNPEYARVTAAYGVFVNADHRYNAGLVIGERSVQENPALTELLIAGQSRTLVDGKKGKKLWGPERPTVYTTQVLGESWETSRDRAISNMATPYKHGLLMSRFAPDTNCFVFDEHVAPNFGIPKISRTMTRFGERIEGLKPRRQLKELGHDTNVEATRFGGMHPVTRDLRSTDFEEFGVMSHLEHIVAAYGVGEAFDKVKAERDAKMPQHPAESILGLPGYRQAVEAVIDPRYPL